MANKHQLNPDQWVELFSDKLLNYALIRIPERDVAKDLVQDAFVVALRSQENYRGEISEKNWLFLILRSRILDYYKKKKEVLESDFYADNDDDSDYFDDRGHWLKDKLPQEWSVDKEVRNNEFQSVFSGCLSGLKQKHKDAFSMKYLEGLETELICKELDISSSNYWVLIHRAKLQLRSCLEKNWFEA